MASFGDSPNTLLRTDLRLFDSQKLPLNSGRILEPSKLGAEELDYALLADKANTCFDNYRSKSISYLVQSLDITGTKSTLLGLRSPANADSNTARLSSPNTAQEGNGTVIGLLPLNKAYNSILGLQSSCANGDFDANDERKVDSLGITLKSNDTPLSTSQIRGINSAHEDVDLLALSDSDWPKCSNGSSDSKGHKRSHSTPVVSFNSSLFQQISAFDFVQSPQSVASELIEDHSLPDSSSKRQSNADSGRDRWCDSLGSAVGDDVSPAALNLSNSQALPMGLGRSHNRRQSLALMEGVAANKPGILKLDTGAFSEPGQALELPADFADSVFAASPKHGHQRAATYHGAQSTHEFQGALGKQTMYSNYHYQQNFVSNTGPGGVSKRTSSWFGGIGGAGHQKRHSIATTYPTMHFGSNPIDESFSSPSINGANSQSNFGTAQNLNLALLGSGAPCPFTPATNPVNPTKSGRNPYRRRARASDQQLQVLNNAFNVCPIPDIKTRRCIAHQCGMTERSVQIWFQNRRAKQKLASNARETQSTLGSIHVPTSFGNLVNQIPFNKFNPEQGHPAAASGVNYGFNF